MSLEGINPEGLGFDTGDERGSWEHRPQIIIPKLGEVALILGLEIKNTPEDVDYSS